MSGSSSSTMKVLALVGQGKRGKEMDTYFWLATKGNWIGLASLATQSLTHCSVNCCRLAAKHVCVVCIMYVYGCLWPLPVSVFSYNPWGVGCRGGWAHNTSCLLFKGVRWDEGERERGREVNSSRGDQRGWGPRIIWLSSCELVLLMP